MTDVLTWNIQCGRGVDGRVDLARIAAVVQEMGSPAVACFQEVAHRYPSQDGGAGADQPRLLANLLPGYRPVFGQALELGADYGPRRQFGNAVLTRLPVLQVLRHLLPRPADPGVRHTQRAALEIVLEASFGPLRIVTTHLEYYSERHRAAQVERLRVLQGEAGALARLEPAAAPPDSIYAPVPRPADCVLCGDLNFGPEDPLYTRVQAPFGEAVPAWQDAWPLVHEAEPHAATCGVADRKQWPQGPHCRDFFFVTEGLAGRVAGLAVNGDTDASDHQPLVLTLHD